MILTENEIIDLLSLYHEQFRLIKEPVYENSKLTAFLLPYRYTYTFEDLDYITATQINLYLSQLTYLLIGSAIKDNKFKNIPKNFYEIFIKNMHKGRLFFVKVNQRMRKMIPKNRELIPAEMIILNYKHIGKTLFSEIKFSIDYKASEGKLLVAMRMEE